MENLVAFWSFWPKCLRLKDSPRETGSVASSLSTCPSAWFSRNTYILSALCPSTNISPKRAKLLRFQFSRLKKYLKFIWKSIYLKFVSDLFVLVIFAVTKLVWSKIWQDPTLPDALLVLSWVRQPRHGSPPDPLTCYLSFSTQTQFLAQIVKSTLPPLKL